MAKVFRWGIVIFIMVAFATGYQHELFLSILETPFQTFELAKTLILSACLWNGILNIFSVSGFMNHLSFILKPCLRWIYGSLCEDETLYVFLSTNFIANLLGLGTLATMSGLKAMKALKEVSHSKTKPSKEMMILVVMNTAGLSLIPTSMMTLRQSYQSQDVISFFKYSVVIGVFITLVGIIVCKVIDRYG